MDFLPAFIPETLVSYAPAPKVFFEIVLFYDLVKNKYSQSPSYFDFTWEKILIFQMDILKDHFCFKEEQVRKPGHICEYL